MMHRSKRLLATTCLSAAMISSAFLPVSVLAQEYNASPRKWGAHADIIGSTAQGESAAGVELFVPMLQNEDSIVFIDGSLNGDFDDEVYGSFGVGYRKLITPDLIIGGIVALDYTRSENGKDYGAVTLGAEAIGPVFEARINVQLPFSDSRKVSETSGPASDVGTVSLIDNRLVEQLAVGILRIDEVPLTGVEGEVGVNLPIGFESLDDDLRVFAGAYHYSGDGVDDFTGVSGRVEYRVHDVFGKEVPGSDLILSAGATHDEERGTNFAGEIRLRVPLGAPPRQSEGDSEYALTALERRMTDHVVRTRKIQTQERRTGSVGDGVSEAVVIDATTGRPLDNIRFADGADTEGAGTLADPTTLGDAVADAGIGGVVVAQGGAGTIDTTGVTLQNGQSLLGGGTTIPIRLADGTVTTFTLGTSIGTIVGAPTASVVSLGQNNILRALDIEGGLAGISGANVGTLIVDRVDISGSAGTGFQISNTSGTNVVGIAGLSVSGAGGAGISIDGSGGGTTTVTGFSGVVISGAGAGGALLSGLVFDASTSTAGFQRVLGGPLAISGVIGDGLRLDGVAGDLAFTDITIANSEGAGLFIRDAGGKAGSFAFGNTGGSITTENGAAIDIDPVALSLRFATVSSTNAAGQGSGGDDGIFIDTITARDAGTAAVVIGSTTVTGAVDSGIFVTNASGGVSFGTTNVSGVGGDGIELVDNDGAIGFATTTVTNAGDDGIAIGTSDGAVSFGTVLIDGVSGDGIELVANNGRIIFGDTTISDPGANGIDISGVNGLVTFGNVDITGLGTGTGLDLTDDGPSTRVALAFATLDITGTGVAGSIGIDYSGTTNTFDVTTTESGTISGVAVGVDLTDAAATGLFRYGDGSATDSDGRASTIDAGQPLLVAGVDGSVGTYDFRDVNLLGDISNLAGLTVFYVDADGGNDAGVTDGSAGDPGTLAQAAASGADVIVLVDNQAGAGQDVIDAAAAIQGVGGTLTLADDQRLAGFGASDTLDLGGGSNVPINVLLTGIDANIITSTNPGSGAPLLTTSLLGATTVELANGNLIQGVSIDNGGGGAAVSGTSTAGLTVRDSQVDSLSLTTSTGAAALRDSTFGSLLVSGGSVAVTGTNADISNADARPTIGVSGGHSGSLAFDAASSVSATGGAGLSFDAALGSYTFLGAITAGGTTNGIAITGGSAGSFTFANAAITNTTGAGLLVGGSSASLTLGGSIAQANAASAVSISGMASGSATISASVSATNGDGLQFDDVDGTVSFTGAVTLNGGDAGIDIVNGSSGGFTFANAAITSPTGTAFNLTASNATVGYTGTIMQTNVASAVSISGMTAGSVTFAGAVSATNGDGLQFDDVDGTVSFTGAVTLNGGDAGIDIVNGSSGSFTFANAAITSPTGTAFNLSGSNATVGYTGTITQANVASAVTISGMTAGSVTFAGAVSATNGDGLQFDDVDGTVSFTGAVTLNGGDAGIDIVNGSSGGFTFANAAITSPTGTAFNLTGSNATVGYTGTITQTNVASAVTISGMTAGSVTFAGAVSATTGSADAIGLLGNAGATIAFNGGLAASTTTGIAFNADGGTIRIAATGGAETLGSSAGRALSLDGVTADIALDGINTTGGVTAVLVNATGGTLGVAGAVSATNATGDAIVLTGNAAAVTFGSVSVANAGGAGLRAETSSGAFTVSGATTISGTVGAGITLAGNGGTTNFGTASVTGAGTTAIAISGNTAQTTFGATTIATPVGNAIDISGTNAGVAFGAVAITGLAANAVGLDFNGAVLTGTVSVASFNLAGTGGTPPAGSIGIDLRGTTGGQTITVGTSANPATDVPSIISNVATGVFLNSASNANFTYGDGESSTDRASRLLSPTPIDAASAPTLGNYNFLDVDFQGARPGNGFGNATAYYFSATGTGTGATITDPGSVAGALASGASALVSLDDGSNNPIDVAGSTTFTLDASQQLLAFASAGGTIDLNYSAPSTIQISAVDIPVTDTVGNGSAALTNTVAGQSVVTLGNGNQLTNIVVDGSAGAGITGAGISGLVLDSVSISNTAGAGLLLTGFNGALVTQNGLDISATGGFGIDIAASAGASGAFGGPTTIDNVTTAGGGVSLSGNGSFVFSGGLDIDTGAGTGFLGTGGAIGVGGTSSISTATGAVIDWSNVAIATGGATFASLTATGTVADDAILLANVDGPGAFSGGTVSILGTSGATSDGIEISGGSAAAVSFGATTIGATGNNGVLLSGANGAVTLASLSSTSAGAVGLLIEDSTANVTISGATTISNAAGQGIFIDAAGATSTIAFGATTTISGAGAGGLVVFQSAAGSTVSLASVAIDGSLAEAVQLSLNEGTVSVTAGTIGSAATNQGGVLVSGGAGTVTIGATISNSAGIGIAIENRAAGTATFGGSLTQSGTGAGMTLANSGGTVSLTSALTLGGTGGGIVATNTGGTTNFAAVTATQTGANEAIDISAATGSASYVFGGQVTASTSAGTATAVSITGAATQTVAFNGGLAITSGANTGFAASGGATIGVAAAGTRTISTTTGQLVSWSGVDVATGGAAFSSLTASGTVAASAILFNDVDGAGTFSGGTVSIAGTSGGGTSHGIEISGGSAASFSFGAATINATSGSAVRLDGANGAVTFASLASSGAGGNGLDVQNAVANVTVTGSTTITDAGLIGIVIQGLQSGTVSLGGTTTVSNSGLDGISVFNSVLGSTVSIASVAIDDAGGEGVELSGNAGTVTISGGTIGATTTNQGGVTVTGGAGAVTIDADIANSAVGTTGVSVTGRSAGTVSFGGAMTLTSTGVGAGVSLGNSGGTVSFTSALTLGGTGGGIVATNTGGTTNFAAVGATQTGANEAIDISAATGSASYVFGGQVTASTSAGTATAVSITGAATQTVAFNGGLAITSGANTGFAASGGATIGVAAAGTRTISTTTGQLVSWSGVDVATGGAAFSSLTASGTVAASAILFNDVDGAGTFSSGTVSIAGTTNAGSDGIAIMGGSAANFAFGATTIGATTGDGIALGAGATGNSGTVTFTGTTTITNPGGAGVDIEGTNGAISFTSLQIALQGPNTTGLDLSGAVVGSGANVTATDFDLTATSGTGTIGVDLAGTTGAGTIRLGDTNVAGASASIAGIGANTAGPAVGVQFSSATNTNFVFGDGEATTDVGSSITALTPVFTTDSLPTAGSYNFLDVVLVGDISALAGPTTYVVDQNGLGTGSFANPGSIGGAELSGADVIVLVDTSLNGTANLIDMALQISGGAVNTIDLADGQVVISLANGESIDVAMLGVSAAGAPSSFQFTGINASSIIAAPLGSIDSFRPILTTNNGPTISLAGSGAVANVVASNTGAAAGSHAISATGFTAGEQLILSGVNVTTANGAGLFLRDNGQDISAAITGFTANAVGGAGLDVAGTSLATGGTGSITITSLANTTIASGAGGGLFDTVIFDADDATAGFQAVSGGASVFGTTASRIQGAGLSFDNVVGNLSFADLDIANNGGTGLSVQNSKANDFTLAVDSGDTGNATVNTTNGTAVFLDPLTVNMIFDTITATGGTSGIVLDTVEGSFRVTGATSITGTSSAGIAIINTAATLSVDFDGAATIDNAASAGGGVSISGNSATTTIDFGGLLDIDTANGTGFAASGGGAVTANGAGSSITTTGLGDAVSVGTGAGSVSIGATVTKTGSAGAAVFVTGRSAGSSVILSGAISRTGANATAVSITGNSGGTVTLSGATKTFNTGTATAVSLVGNTGSTVAFSGGGLDIDTTSGTGFFASGGGTITVTGTGNSLATTTGTGLALDGVTVGASGLAFGSVTANGAATGIALTSVTSSGGGAIALGTVNLQGITSRGIDVTTALGAALQVTDLDIGLAGGAAVGLDLNGAALTAGITVGDFDLTSTAVGTTIGVDLRGVTGAQTIQLGAGAPASIAGVDTGVFLNSASNANFTFGDGANAPTSSTIVANFGIDAASAPAAGSYNFQDVAFPGSPGRGFGVGRILFVDSDGAIGGGTGSGNSAANAATLAAAQATSAGGNGDVFVLINNGSTISGGATSLALAASQQVRGFGNGAINIAITPVANITLSSNAINIADPGSGAATLTAAAGAGQVITLGPSGNVIDGFTLSGTGGATRGINDNGSGASNTLIDHMTVSNFSTVGIEITPSTSTTIQNTAFSGNASDVLVNAANTTIQNVTSTASTGTAFQINNATGTTTLSGITITGAGTGIAFGGTGATGPVNLTNVNISAATALSVVAGTGAFTGTNVDLTGSTSALTVSGGSNTMSFDAASSITGTGGTAVSIAGRAGGSFTHAGTVAVDGAGASFLSVSGATVANTVSFSGAVDVGQTTRAASGVAINNNGTASTVAFANLDLRTSGTAFTASGGGTATATTGTIDSTGAAASLNGIAANLVFTSTTSTGGTSNISLLNTSGTASFGTGALSGASGLVAFAVDGGTVSTSYAGSIGYAGTGQLVGVSSAHSGTLAFSGTLTASTGTGIAFNNADGIYNFTGTTTLNGGDAGVDIVNGSGGTISFGSGTSITSPSGTGINVANSTATLTYSGNLTQANNAAAITVNAHSGGTLTFNTGTISATNGSGLQFDNADGTYVFSGTTTLNGGDAGIDILNASTGTFTFGAGTAITHNTGTGTAFNLSVSNANVTYSGSIIDNVGYAVDIDGHDGGTVSFQTGSISASGSGALGVRVQNSNGGSVNLNGQTTLSTGANTAVTLVGNTGGTVGFNTTGNGLDITTTSGAGFSATGGGTVTVQGAGNTISSAGGTALNIASTTIGVAGVTFQSISANGGVNGIVLNTTGASGGLTVTGTGAAGSGGTIQNSTGAGILLTTTRDVSLDRMIIQNTVRSGIDGTGVVDFALTNSTITNSGITAGNAVVGQANDSNIAFNDQAGGTENNLSGVVNISGNTLSRGYYHGVSIFNYAGTISDLTIANNSYASATTATVAQGNGIQIVAFGSASAAANITRATINSNTITNIPLGVGISVQGGNSTVGGPGGSLGTPGNATNVIAITNNTIDGISGTVGSEGIVASITGANAGSRGQANFDIAGNTIIDRFGQGISASTFGNATSTMKIRNNTIDTNNAGASIGSNGIGAGTGIVSSTAETPLMTMLVDNNTITDYDGTGIRIVALDAAGTINATITNNQIGPSGGAAAGYPSQIGFLVGSDSGGGNNTINLDLRANVGIGTNVATNAPGIGFRVATVGGATNTLRIEGLSPSPATQAQVITYVSGQNPGIFAGTLGGSYTPAQRVEFVNGNAPASYQATPGNVPEP